MHTKRLCILLFLAAGFTWAQVNPDCQFTLSFTAATPQAPAFSNKPTTTTGPACTSWIVSYWTTGASGVSVQIEGAPDPGTGIPPTTGFTALTGATSPVTSANPATGTDQGNILACCDYYPWIRINPTVFTGTSQKMTVRVYGYKGTSQVASGGGGGGHPTGPAGGDLAGSYPDPTVANLSNVSNGSLGNAGLTNAATTVNGQTCTLGSTCTVTAVPSGSASGDLGGSYPAPTVAGINGVPLCTGFTPTNGQNVQYLTGGTPNPCWTAAAGGGSIPSTTQTLKGDGAGNAAGIGSSSTDCVHPDGSSGTCPGASGAVGVVLSGSADPAATSVPVVVQATASYNGSGNGATYASTVTANNLSVVFINSDSVNSWTPSDTLHTSYFLAFSYTGSHPSVVKVWVGILPSSGADTVTATGSGGNPSIVLWEISGSNGTVDLFNGNSGTAPPTILTTVAYDLILIGMGGNDQPLTYGATSPTVLDAYWAGSGSYYGVGGGHLPALTVTTYTPAMTSSTSGSTNVTFELEATVPSSPGVNGDWYLNTTTGILWGPKTGGLWSPANITALDSVSLCTGFTPTNGQLLQYTTGGSPNPCWTAATAGGPFVNLQSTTPGTPQTGNSHISGTGIFGAGLLFGTTPISFGAGTQPLYNIWIGGTGASNTTGNNNSALGPNVLSSNTSGGSNSALGYNALSSNISGSQNSALGAYALSSNTGSYNSAHGYDALNANTSGNGNSAHGYQALYFNTTGTYNSALGLGAGYTANSAYANVSGSHNSWVGYNSGPGSATQYSYQTVIGAAAVGTCSNCVVLGRAGGLDTVYAGDAGVDPMVVLALATTPVLSTALKVCTATTGIPWRASVTDAVAPALGVALTGGGTVFANVHCSLTTGTYIVDGI